MKETVDLSKVDPLPFTVWDERSFDEDLLIAELEKLNRRYRITHIWHILRRNDLPPSFRWRFISMPERRMFREKRFVLINCMAFGNEIISDSAA